MRKKLTLILALIILCTAAYAADEDVPCLKLIDKSISNEQITEPLDVLKFEFNLRIDHVGISALLNGSTDKIEKVSIKEGKRIEINLKEPLSDETEYSLTLSGIKDIYISQPLALFFAKVKNNLTTPKEIKFVLVAKEKKTREILDVKILTQNIDCGQFGVFSHTFTQLKGNYELHAYGFYDLGKVMPLKFNSQ